MRMLAYLSHPIGVGNGEDMVHRQDNIANAAAWLRFLVMHTRWAICCPWYPYVVTLDGETHRPRGLVDNLICLERCDVVVQVGGRVSAHMEEECVAARERSIPIVNLTDLGYAPPWTMAINEVSRTLSHRAHAVLAAAPRVPWMAPLSEHDVAELRGAIRQLREQGASGDSLRGVLERIALAARPST